eukprot:scaffold74330_cov19-Tisochrysis_lutea.AAC.1
MLGADLLELDVQMTKDGVVVVVRKPSPPLQFNDVNLGRCMAQARSKFPLEPEIGAFQWFHDVTLGRMCGPAYDGVQVEDLDFADLPPLNHIPPAAEDAGKKH